MRPFSRWSIQWKLPLGGALLLLLVIGALFSAAYTEVRRSAREAAAERLVSVSNQLVDMFNASARQLRAQTLAMAENRALRAFLDDSTPANRPAAIAALAYAGPQATQVATVELWDRSGHLLLTSGEAMPPDAARGPGLIGHLGNDSVLIGGVQVAGDHMFYPAVARIGRDGIIGYLAIWRVVRSSPESRKQLMDLIGSQASIYLGSRDGTAWTDLARVAAPPPVPVSDLDHPAEYERADGGPRLGVARKLVGSEWVVLVEFAGSVASAPARSFLLRQGSVTALLLAVALLLLWLASRSLMLPLRRLTKGVEAISAGDYSYRVSLDREDELGRLGQVLDDMAGKILGEQHLLEAKVEERTRELHVTLERLRAGERRLSEAKEAAEQGSRAKSDFLAKMSHELRTPLNSIIGFCEVLQARTFGALNDKQDRYVGNVLASGRQLLDLINDILDLSKVEAGRMELSLSEFSIESSLADVQAAFGPLAERKQLTISVEVEEGLPVLVADAGKVRQVLNNLISNAVKFTEPGGQIRITARRFPGEAPHQPIELIVADTGIGIRKEDQVRIFDEFEQIDSPYAREQHGTGLGLALTRRLVELHGGRIWLESTLGRGSVFHVTLPLSPVTVDQPAAVVPTAVEQPSADAPLVLVVEEDLSSRAGLVRFLAVGGFRAQVADSPEEALRLAAVLRPDVITLDIMLPDGRGHEVLRRLKESAATKDIPVIVLSMSEERELGLSLGVAEWLVKPTHREDFLAAVRRAAGAMAAGTRPGVLVIDDEPQSIEFLTDLLEHQGYDVVAARGGRAGVLRALERRFDVIVLDLMMPDLTGFEVVRRVRGSPLSHDVPIVVFSVKDLTTEERRELEAAVQAIVMKGRGREALLRELARLAQPLPLPA